MSLLNATIPDDRGRTVPLVAYPAGADRQADPQRTRRIRDAAAMQRGPATPAEVRRGIIYGCLALPLLLAAALVPAYIAFNTALPWWTQILASLPLGGLPALGTVFLVRRIAARRIARVHLRAGYCGSCGYDLTALPDDAHGLRTCPECSAAWRGVGTPDDLES